MCTPRTRVLRMLRVSLVSCILGFSGNLSGWYTLDPIQPKTCRVSVIGAHFMVGPNGLLGAIGGIGSSDLRPDLLGRVALNLGANPRPVSVPNMHDRALYLDFFTSTLDFALFPHRGRHPLAVAARLNGQKHAWGWIQGEVRVILNSPTRVWRIRFALFPPKYFIALATAVCPARGAQDGVRIIRIAAYDLGTSCPEVWLGYKFATFGLPCLLVGGGEKERSSEKEMALGTVSGQVHGGLTDSSGKWGYYERTPRRRTSPLCFPRGSCGSFFSPIRGRGSK